MRTKSARSLRNPRKIQNNCEQKQRSAKIRCFFLMKWKRRFIMPIFDRDHADSPEKAYVYILRCADGTLYCGWTNDLAARLDAHNSGKGAKYTRGRVPQGRSAAS